MAGGLTEYGVKGLREYGSKGATQGVEVIIYKCSKKRIDLFRKALALRIFRARMNFWIILLNETVAETNS